MADTVRSPLNYTGRRVASTTEAGSAQFDSSDFAVNADGKVSLAAASVAETYTTDSGTVTPASSAITVAGGAGIDTSGSGATLTIAIEETDIQYTEVSLTSAEVKALAATQKELVAAPGAGKCVEFVSALLKLDYGSNVFTEAGDNLAIKYTNASGVAVSQTIETTGFIDQSADTYTNAVPEKDQIVAATGCENQALVLDNLGSEIAGNAANDSALIIGIAYRVHTL